MRILDAGLMYGFPCAEPLFDPWDPTIVTLTRNKPFDGAVLDNIDLIIFGGGQDVCPKLYNHRNVASHCGEEPSERDLWEQDLYKVNMFRPKPVPMLGICRGAQFLCVMTGGFLVQHIDNHAGRDHLIKLVDNPFGSAVVMGNSYHHQMMVPGPKARIFGYTENLSKTWLYDVIKTAEDKEKLYHDLNYEIVKFDQHAVGFQPHPEYLNPFEPLAVLTRKYVDYQFGFGKERP